MRKYLLFFFLLPLFFSSCVAKKKHLEIIAAYDTRIDSLQHSLDTSGQRNFQLVLDITERKGENNALLASQDKLLDRIIALDDEIESLQNESASRVESLDSRMQQKDDMIAERQARLDALAATLNQRDQGLQEVEIKLRESLQELDSTLYTIELNNGQLSVSLQQEFLFYTGSTSKTHTAGRAAVEKISNILANYPSLNVLAIGHTDNSPLRRQSISDKWEFSAMQAATVVQLMCKKYELSTSRVMVGAKGEFEPRASNNTPEGRAANQRIEIRIFPARESLIRDLRRRLED